MERTIKDFVSVCFNSSTPPLLTRVNFFKNNYSGLQYFVVVLINKYAFFGGIEKSWRIDTGDSKWSSSMLRALIVDESSVCKLRYLMCTYFYSFTQSITNHNPKIHRSFALSTIVYTFSLNQPDRNKLATTEQEPQLNCVMKPLSNHSCLGKF